MTKRGPWNVIVRGVCCLFLGSTGAALIGNVMQKTAKIRSGRGSLTNFSKKITGLQQHYLCRIRYLQERTPKKNRRPACGGQPADAYRRMLAPAEASLCKCLAKSAGASLYAYRANAYRYALSVHRRCKTSYTPPSTRRATCTRTQHPRGFVLKKRPNTMSGSGARGAVPDVTAAEPTSSESAIPSVSASSIDCPSGAAWILLPVTQADRDPSKAPAFLPSPPARAFDRGKWQRQRCC